MEPATTEDVSRLTELIKEANTLAKPDLIAALVALGQEEDELHDQNVSALRALLAATTLHRERQEDRPEPDAADDPEDEPLEGVIVGPDDPAAQQDPEAQQVTDEVGQALALREGAPTPQRAIPTPDEFNALIAIASHLYRTTFVPVSYRGKQEDCLAAMMFGREIGLGPMQSLRDVYMIDGKPALAAHLQLALLRRGGIRILESESTRERAFIRAQRADTGEIMAVEWTYEEAEPIRDKHGKALVDKDNWRNYRADMLWSRAVGRLTRRLGPDMIGGLPPYVAEEVADFSDWGVNYGETGPAFTAPARAQQQPAERRQQEAGRNEIPRSWAEVTAWAAQYGEEIGWKEWIADAAERLYATRVSADLTTPQKAALLQKASGAVVKLHEIHPPGEFPPPSREEIQRAWSAVLDGEILAGPLWRLSPGESEVPTYHAAHGLPEPEAPAGEPQGTSTAEAPTSDSAPTDEVAKPEEAPQTSGEEEIVDAEWTESAEDIPFAEEHDNPYP